MSLRGCSHEHEPAVPSEPPWKEVNWTRIATATYLKLKKESQYHDMSYLDKRRKENKAFGRFIKCGEEAYEGLKHSAALPRGPF